MTAAAVTVLAMTTALFPEAVLEGRVFFYRDLHLSWVPQVEAFVRCVAEGSWPVWNRNFAFGQPLLANPNNQVLYPPTWLNFLMRPWRYYTLYVVGHFMLAGLGMYLAARRLRVTPGAALVAAIAWIGGGPFVSLVSLWNHLGAAAWIPWSAATAGAAFATGSRPRAVVWGLTLAAPVLAGSPEVALMAAAAGVLMFVARRGKMSLAAAARVVATAAFVAVLVSAGQWLPSLALSARSIRSMLPPGEAAFWSLPGLTLLQMAAPIFLDGLPLQGAVRQALFESRDPFLPSLYLGATTAGLALAALRRRRPMVWVLAALWGASVLLAMGRHGPLYPVLMEVLPPLQALRFPAKAMVMASFAWAALVGLGVDQASRGAMTAGRWRPLVVVAAVLAASLGTAAAMVGLGAETWGALVVAPEFTQRALSAVLSPVARALATAAALSVAAVVALARASRTPHRTWARALALLVAVDLVLAHRALSPTTETELFTLRPLALENARPPNHTRVYSFDYSHPPSGLEEIGPPRYVLKVKKDELLVPWADAAALRMALFPSILGYWGIETAYNHDGLGLFSRELTGLTWLLGAANRPETRKRLLEMGAVSRVVALHANPVAGLRHLATVPGLFREPTSVYALPTSLPRAYVVDGVRVDDGREALATIEDPAFEPRRELLLPAGTPRASDPSFTGRASIALIAPDRTRVDAELSAPGHLVLVDNYDPGWRATVDGAPAEVLRGNLAFTAVALLPGRHTIELVYRPREVALGLGLSAFGVAGAAAVLVRGRGRGRGARRGDRA